MFGMQTSVLFEPKNTPKIDNNRCFRVITDILMLCLDDERAMLIWGGMYCFIIDRD